jgi:hypothetical protein
LVSPVVWQSLTELLAFIGPDKWLAIWLWFLLLDVDIVTRFRGSFENSFGSGCGGSGGRSGASFAL